MRHRIFTTSLLPRLALPLLAVLSAILMTRGRALRGYAANARELVHDGTFGAHSSPWKVRAIPRHGFVFSYAAHTKGFVDDFCPYPVCSDSLTQTVWVPAVVSGARLTYDVRIIGNRRHGRRCSDTLTFTLGSATRKTMLLDKICVTKRAGRGWLYRTEPVTVPLRSFRGRHARFTIMRKKRAGSDSVVLVNVSLTASSPHPATTATIPTSAVPPTAPTVAPSPVPNSSPAIIPTPTPTAFPTETPAPRPSSTPAPTATLSRGVPVISGSGVAVGARISDWGLDAPNDAAAIDSYASMAGRAPAIVMWFQAWGESHHGWSDRLAGNVYQRGAVPMITWDPCTSCTPSDTSFSLAGIVRGNYDSFIRQWALGAAHWGHPFFLRFAHEMNGDWYPWGTESGNVQRNTPTEYIAAWRHVHDIFGSVGATNAIWVWSPNTDFPGSTPYSSLYPGDSYVDWMGVDAYNTGTTTGGGWMSFPTLFGSSYADVVSLSSKPLMIAEMASAEAGGNKATWITDTFLHDIPALYPRVRAAVWFDDNKTAKGETDWRVNSSAASLAAWKQVVSSPLYGGRVGQLRRR